MFLKYFYLLLLLCWLGTSWRHSLVVVFCCVQIEVIRGLAVLKKATAIVNKEFGLDEKLADVIVEASEEVWITDADDDAFDFLADLTAHTVWSAIGIILSSVCLSVCDKEYCG